MAGAGASLTPGRWGLSALGKLARDTFLPPRRSGQDSCEPGSVLAGNGSVGFIRLASAQPNAAGSARFAGLGSPGSVAAGLSHGRAESRPG